MERGKDRDKRERKGRKEERKDGDKDKRKQGQFTPRGATPAGSGGQARRNGKGAISPNRPLGGKSHGRTAK